MLIMFYRFHLSYVMFISRSAHKLAFPVRFSPFAPPLKYGLGRLSYDNDCRQIGCDPVVFQVVEAYHLRSLESLGRVVSHSTGLIRWELNWASQSTSPVLVSTRKKVYIDIICNSRSLSLESSSHWCVPLNGPPCMGLIDANMDISRL